MERDALLSFVRKHAALTQGKPNRYAKLFTGRSRKTAESVVRWDLTGEKPEAVVGEVEDRLDRLARAGDQGWLVVFEVGGKNPIDTFHLGAGGGDDEGTSSAPAEIAEGPAGLTALVGFSMDAVVRTNAQLTTQLNAERERNADLMLRHVEVAGRAVASETLLTWIQEHGLPGQEDSGELLAAVAAAAPSMAPVMTALIERMGSSKKERKPPPADADRTPAQIADQVLADLDTLLDKYPEEIKARAIQIGQRGQRLQEIFAK